MSPSELDLRGALRDGEGDGPDADAVIAGARAHRAQRRTRLLTVAAAVVVVVGAATGISALVHSGGGSDEVGDSVAGAGGAVPALGAATGVPTGAATDQRRNGPAAEPSQTVPGASGSGAVSCPRTFPQLLLPGGGSPGQFGSGGPLFSVPVATVTVCVYTADDTGGGAGRVLTGTLAQNLVNDLEDASKTRAAIRCPDIVTGEPRSFAFIGVTAGGRALRPVTTTITQPACNTQVTNGTAVRYNWQPSAFVARGVLARTPQIGGGTVRSGYATSGATTGAGATAVTPDNPTDQSGPTEHGSPIH